MRDWLSIADGLYLWRHLPAWDRSHGKRIVKHSKGHLPGNGLLHHLAFEIGQEHAVRCGIGVGGVGLARPWLVEPSPCAKVTAFSNTQRSSASSGCEGSGRSTPNWSHSSERNNAWLARSEAPLASQRLRKFSRAGVEAVLEKQDQGGLPSVQPLRPM